MRGRWGPGAEDRGAAKRPARGGAGLEELVVAAPLGARVYLAGSSLTRVSCSVSML